MRSRARGEAEAAAHVLAAESASRMLRPQVHHAVPGVPNGSEGTDSPALRHARAGRPDRLGRRRIGTARANEKHHWRGRTPRPHAVGRLQLTRMRCQPGWRVPGSGGSTRWRNRARARPWPIVKRACRARVRALVTGSRRTRTPAPHNSIHPPPLPRPESASPHRR